MKIEKTDRGFFFCKFKDNYSKECSIQESSAVPDDEGAYIWLGFDNPEILQAGYDKQHPARTRTLPSDIKDTLCLSTHGRMHLSQMRLKKLLPYLQYFADHGELPKSEIEEQMSDTKETYSMEKIIQIWNDKTGERFELGQDRDSCYLFELRCYTPDNTLVQDILLPLEVAELVGKAIPEIVAHIRESERLDDEARVMRLAMQKASDAPLESLDNEK